MTAKSAELAHHVSRDACSSAEGVVLFCSCTAFKHLGDRHSSICRFGSHTSECQDLILAHGERPLFQRSWEGSAASGRVLTTNLLKAFFVLEDLDT